MFQAVGRTLGAFASPIALRALRIQTLGAAAIAALTHAAFTGAAGGTFLSCAA